MRKSLQSSAMKKLESCLSLRILARPVNTFINPIHLHQCIACYPHGGEGRVTSHALPTYANLAFRLNAQDTRGKDADDSLHCCSFAKGTPWFSHGGKSINCPLLGCITSSSSLSTASSLLFEFCANSRLLPLSNNGLFKTSGAHLKGQLL